MNVYDHIDANNRKTIVTLCAFPAALFATVFLFALLFAKTGILSHLTTGIRYLVTAKNAPDFADRVLLQTGVLDQTMRLTLMIYPWMILIAFVWIIISYRAGGSMILKIARARNVTQQENRELFRLVENTAVMAGLPTPKIFLITDDSMNAFATGRSPETSSIALTAGLVKNLSKPELQAVIAHEFAHIGNRDTRLMQIIVTGIGCFIFFGELLCRGSRGGRRGKVNALLFFAGLVCLLFGYVIAPILRFALSRVMEYRADATAVKIIRNQDALVRALTKIATDPRVEVLDASPLTGNMCIVNPAKVGFISRLYSTHPTIEERLAALMDMMGTEEAPPVRPQVGRAIW